MEVRISTKPPTKEQTLLYWNTILIHYLTNLQPMLAKLEPIAQLVASNNGDNTVIVMVCNYGQSELLLNFVCNARAKQLDTSSILLFATDQETHDLALGLGLTSFYHVDMFGSKAMPKQAAKRYADQNFMAMMGAKVFCVQMISMLGFNILFQDVDVIWYQNPLLWFQKQEQGHDKQFDMYFQDDGNHALFYAAYSANTGFYYVRHNDRTRYFFNSLLVAGDLILSTHSHQIALIALLNEHASMYALSVKIWERHTTDFPGGFTFHRNAEFMRDLVSGQLAGTPQMPYIFHMSWTLNKENKKLFYRQMGEWFLQDTCIGSIREDILQRHHLGKSHSNGHGTSVLVAPCCTAEPLVSCHYRDKPSKVPCKESPPIDAGKPSFW
jgi:Nucleotide-diphospho-sugar transferase